MTRSSLTWREASGGGAAARVLPPLAGTNCGQMTSDTIDRHGRRDGQGLAVRREGLMVLWEEPMVHWEGLVVYWEVIDDVLGRD